MIGERIRTRATGLGFPEGPVVLDGDARAVVEIQGQRITRIDADGGMRHTPTSGGPNGMTRAHDGALLIANNGGLSVGPAGYWFADPLGNGSIQRLDPTGDLSTLVGSFPAPEPWRPNDLCFGPDGALYVTDPHNWEDFANLGPGRLWRVTMDGAVELLTEHPGFPNGIAFHPDGRVLVATTIEQRLVAYDWRDGELSNPRTFATLPDGFPDGFCVTADGHVIACGSMGHVIHVFDADGAHVGRLETGADTEPTNCCLGDGVLTVTLSGTGEVVDYACDAEALPLFDGASRERTARG